MQQIDFVKYELATGKILSAVSCPEYAYASNTPPSTEFGYFLGAVTDIGAFYVANKQLVERPIFNLPETPIQIQADGVDSFELNNLPQGTIVTLVSSDEEDADSYEINDSELSFATDQPGFYTLYIKAFPYREATITIEATL